MAARIDFTNDGYDSDLEEPEPKKTWRSDPLAKKDSNKSGLPNKKVFRDEVDAAARRIGRYNGFMAMDAYSRHKQFINYYCLHFVGKEHYQRDTSKDRNDFHILAEHHRFLWDDDEEDVDRLSWEKQLAKKYYDKLFKEYCIADLSLYKENKVAMRWRVEREVLGGKGQFVCGEKRCSITENLKSWEVNFGYVEAGAKKNALVKLRLCETCSAKLNYHHMHKRIRLEKKLRRARKRERQESRRAARVEQRSRDTDKRASSSDNSCAEESSSTDTHGDAKARTEAVLASIAGGAPASTSAEKKESKGQDDADGSNQLWRQAVQVEPERSREEEFDDYFQDMFL